MVIPVGDTSSTVGLLLLTSLPKLDSFFYAFYFNHLSGWVLFKSYISLITNKNNVPFRVYWPSGYSLLLSGCPNLLPIFYFFLVDL